MRARSDLKSRDCERTKSTSGDGAARAWRVLGSLAMLLLAAGGCTSQQPGEPRRLLDVDRSVVVHGITADGHVVLTRDAGGVRAVQVMALAGGTPLTIAPVAGRTEVRVVGNAALVFTSLPSSGALAGDLTVWTHASGAHTAPRKALFSSEVTTASASADGAWVAYGALAGPGGEYDVVLTPTSLAQETILLPGSCAPVVDFASRWLIVQGCDVDGPTVDVYEPASATRVQRLGSAGTWATGGNQVFFLEYGSVGYVGTLGGAPLQLVESSLDEAHVRGDGQSVLFVRSDGSIRRLERGAKQSVPVTGFAAGHVHPSPDGRWVFFYADQSGSRISAQLASTQGEASAVALNQEPTGLPLREHFTRDSAFVLYGKQALTTARVQEVQFRAVAGGASQPLSAGVRQVWAGRAGWVVFTSNVVTTEGEPERADVWARDLRQSSAVQLAPGVNADSVTVAEDGAVAVYAVTTGTSAEMGLFAVELP